MSDENTLPEETTPAPEEKFEISLRLLGNEIVAMALLSQSMKKNWVVFGLIAFILTTIILERLVPVIEKMQTVM